MLGWCVFPPVSMVLQYCNIDTRVPVNRGQPRATSQSLHVLLQHRRLRSSHIRGKPLRRRVKNPLGCLVESDDFLNDKKRLFVCEIGVSNPVEHCL